MMPKPARRIGLAALVLAAGAAVAAAQDPRAALRGPTWYVVEVDGVPVPRQGSSPGREPHLLFEADGRVSGSDGCNRLAGSYTSEGDGLRFGALVGTMMACPKVGDLPQRVRRAFEATSRFGIEGGRLRLLAAEGTPVAVLERRTQNGRSSSGLLGTSWQLVSLTLSQGRILTPDDPTRYTLVFSPGGTLMVRLDCNRGRGTWEAPGARALTLGPLALTRALCPEGSLHDPIVQAWSHVRSFELKGTNLVLTPGGGGGTVLEFRPLTVETP